MTTVREITHNPDTGALEIDTADGDRVVVKRDEEAGTCDVLVYSASDMKQMGMEDSPAPSQTLAFAADVARAVAARLGVDATETLLVSQESRPLDPIRDPFGDTPQDRRREPRWMHGMQMVGNDSLVTVLDVVNDRTVAIIPRSCHEVDDGRLLAGARDLRAAAGSAKKMLETLAEERPEVAIGPHIELLASALSQAGHVAVPVTSPRAVITWQYGKEGVPVLEGTAGDEACKLLYRIERDDNHFDRVYSWRVNPDTDETTMLGGHETPSLAVERCAADAERMIVADEEGRGSA